MVFRDLPELIQTFLQEINSLLCNMGITQFELPATVGVYTHFRVYFHFRFIQYLGCLFMTVRVFKFFYLFDVNEIE